MNNLHTTDTLFMVSSKPTFNEKVMFDCGVHCLHVRVVAFEWHELDVYSGFQASVEFRFKPRQNSPTNPTWHPLRIKFPTEISKIPNNSFSIKGPMKSDNEFEKIDQRSVCSHYALYASLH